MDQKWTKYEYVCSYCDSAITFVTQIIQNQMVCPACFNGYATLLSVEDATINTNNEQEGAPMNATTTFLETQAQTLTEAIEKKDALIAKLQDELHAKTNLVMTVRGEQRNFTNSIKEFTVQAVRDNDITIEVAQALAEIADFELTKTITITSTVDFEVEVEVPLDVDADDVIASLEYSVDAFDYSISDYSLDTRNVDWEDTIS